MILLSLALAQDCPEPETTLLNLRAEPSQFNYDCAAALGVERLVEAAAEPLPNPDRVTRALVVHRLDHLDEPIGVDEAWTYRPADLRLLADGIHAHRGRKSPSKAHEVVFEKFDWYAPSSSYTDGRLTEVDRANLQMLKDPPLPGTDEPAAADAMASGADAPARRESACACTTGGVGPWALAGLILLARRGRAPSGGRGRAASPPPG